MVTVDLIALDESILISYFRYMCILSTGWFVLEVDLKIGLEKTIQRPSIGKWCYVAVFVK